MYHFQSPGISYWLLISVVKLPRPHSNPVLGFPLFVLGQSENCVQLQELVQSPTADGVVHSVFVQVITVPNVMSVGGMAENWWKYAQTLEKTKADWREIPLSCMDFSYDPWPFATNSVEQHEKLLEFFRFSIGSTLCVAFTAAICPPTEWLGLAMALFANWLLDWLPNHPQIRPSTKLYANPVPSRWGQLLAMRHNYICFSHQLHSRLLYCMS